MGTLISKLHFFMPQYSNIALPDNETYRGSLKPTGMEWETIHRWFDTILVLIGALMYIGIALYIRFKGSKSQLKGKEIRILAQAAAITAGYLYFDLMWVITIATKEPGGKPPAKRCPVVFTWKFIGIYLAVAGNGVIYMVFNKDLQNAVKSKISGSITLRSTSVKPVSSTK